VSATGESQTFNRKRQSTRIELLCAIVRSYFAAYEALVEYHMRSKGVSRSEISPLWAVTYGAAAGENSCIRYFEGKANVGP
jgi:hypothetical protein